jgi:hypothetical protein
LLLEKALVDRRSLPPAALHSSQPSFGIARPAPSSWVAVSDGVPHLQLLRHHRDACKVLDSVSRPHFDGLPGCPDHYNDEGCLPRETMGIDPGARNTGDVARVVLDRPIEQSGHVFR